MVGGPSRLAFVNSLWWCQFFGSWPMLIDISLWVTIIMCLLIRRQDKATILAQKNTLSFSVDGTMGRIKNLAIFGPFLLFQILLFGEFLNLTAMICSTFWSIFDSKTVKIVRKWKCLDTICNNLFGLIGFIGR